MKCQHSYSWLALNVYINGIDIWLYVLQIMIRLLVFHCGHDPFWSSASSSCLLGWKWGQCRLAKSTACPLSLLWVSRLCLPFFLNLLRFLRCLSSVPLTEQLLEFMHQLPAFANMTMSVRRELCAVMVFAVVERAGTIVLNDGEEVRVRAYSCTHKPCFVILSCL